MLPRLLVLIFFIFPVFLIFSDHIFFILSELSLIFLHFFFPNFHTIKFFSNSHSLPHTHSFSPILLVDFSSRCILHSTSIYNFPEVLFYSNFVPSTSPFPAIHFLPAVLVLYSGFRSIHSIRNVPTVVLYRLSPILPILPVP